MLSLILYYNLLGPDGLHWDCERNTTCGAESERLTGERWLLTIVTGGRWTDDGDGGDDDDKERRRHRQRSGGGLVVAAVKRWWNGGGDGGSGGRRSRNSWGNRSLVRSRASERSTRNTCTVWISPPIASAFFFLKRASPASPPIAPLPKDECRLDTFVPMSRFVRYAETTIIPLARDCPHEATLIVIRPNAHLYTVGVTQRGHGVPIAALQYRNIIYLMQSVKVFNAPPPSALMTTVSIMPLDIFYLFYVLKTPAGKGGLA